MRKWLHFVLLTFFNFATISYKLNIIFPHVHIQVKLEVPCFEVVSMENLDFGGSVYDEVNSSKGIIGRDEFSTSPENFSKTDCFIKVFRTGVHVYPRVRLV
jgi:hypothetical protein